MDLRLIFFWECGLRAEEIPSGLDVGAEGLRFGIYWLEGRNRKGRNPQEGSGIRMTSG